MPHTGIAKPIAKRGSSKHALGMRRRSGSGSRLVTPRESRNETPLFACAMMVACWQKTREDKHSKLGEIRYDSDNLSNIADLLPCGQIPDPSILSAARIRTCHLEPYCLRERGGRLLSAQVYINNAKATMRAVMHANDLRMRHLLHFKCANAKVHAEDRTSLFNIACVELQLDVSSLMEPTLRQRSNGVLPATVAFPSASHSTTCVWFELHCKDHVSLRIAEYMRKHCNAKFTPMSAPEFAFVHGCVVDGKYVVRCHVNLDRRGDLRCGRVAADMKGCTHLFVRETGRVYALRVQPVLSFACTHSRIEVFENGHIVFEANVLDCSKQDAKASTVLEPFVGSHRFWFLMGRLGVHVYHRLPFRDDAHTEDVAVHAPLRKFYAAEDDSALNVAMPLDDVLYGKDCGCYSAVLSNPPFEMNSVLEKFLKRLITDRGLCCVLLYPNRGVASYMSQYAKSTVQECGEKEYPNYFIVTGDHGHRHLGTTGVHPQGLYLRSISVPTFILTNQNTNNMTHEQSKEYIETAVRCVNEEASLADRAEFVESVRRNGGGDSATKQKKSLFVRRIAAVLLFPSLGPLFIPAEKSERPVDMPKLLGDVIEGLDIFRTNDFGIKLCEKLIRECCTWVGTREHDHHARHIYLGRDEKVNRNQKWNDLVSSWNTFIFTLFLPYVTTDEHSYSGVDDVNNFYLLLDALSA